MFLVEEQAWNCWRVESAACQASMWQQPQGQAPQPQRTPQDSAAEGRRKRHLASWSECCWEPAMVDRWPRWGVNRHRLSARVGAKL